MRKSCSTLLACMIALTLLLAGEATAGGTRKHAARSEKGTAGIYGVQTTRVRHRCFPGKLRRILAHIAMKVGRRPLVTSGSRSTGRKGSMHRRCLAADLRVPGVPVKRIVAAARSAPAIGGVGTYCNGIVHVDVGPKRRWHHCGGRARRYGRARR